jgi:hypothetical protein
MRYVIELEFECGKNFFKKDGKIDHSALFLELANAYKRQDKQDGAKFKVFDFHKKRGQLDN